MPTSAIRRTSWSPGPGTAWSAPPVRIPQELDTTRVEAIFHKGEHAAAYSGFEGHAEDGECLADWLRRHDVDRVDVVGIATDHCVRATALDAAREGFATTVLLGLTAAVAPATTDVAVRAMDGAGVIMHGQPVIRAA